MIQTIVQISYKFCEQEAWNAETASLAWVESVNSYTIIIFAQTMITLKALALAIPAAHWPQRTVLWSGSIRGDPVCAVAGSQMFTLVFSRTSNSSETTWNSLSSWILQHSADTTSQIFIMNGIKNGCTCFIEKRVQIQKIVLYTSLKWVVAFHFVYTGLLEIIRTWILFWILYQAPKWS